MGHPYAYRPPQPPNPQAYYYPRAFYPQGVPYAYAPQPHRPRQPRPSTGIGCIGWFFITVIGGGVLLVGGIFVIIAIAVGVSEDDGSTPVATTDDQTGQTTTTGTSTVTPTAKGGTEVQTTGKVREIEGAFTVGRCSGPEERRRNEYQLARNNGTARRLRGKIAVLHLRLGLRGASWSKGGEERVDHASLASSRFLLEESKRHGIGGLEVHPIPWTLTSTYELPELRVGSNSLLSTEMMKRIEREARDAVETAMATTLESMSSDLKKDGYDEVAFAVHFPAEVKIRDWAAPAYNSQGKGKADVCFIFSPMTSDFGAFAVVVTHETLHLFGADDLYRITGIDPDDRGDLMDVYCSGFAHTHVGEATSYAIGWRAAPPSRTYSFKDY